mgnify:CR=1 FL=1
MQDNYDGWQILKELPSGGQGRVYIALSPDHVETKRKSIRNILNAARAYSGGTDQTHQEAFAGALSEFISSENKPHLGALKELYIKPGRDEKEAVARFENEVSILSENRNPALLKLLYANVAKRFMVTEYHPEGSLATRPDRYKADAVAALFALRPIVKAVRELHSKGIIHRDIKTANIFVASDGRIVLGDFGIVFYEDPEGKRLTKTFEKVGTHDWMPPWCNTGKRIERPGFSFDVYTLGKLLWAMIAGELLPYWFHRRKEYNLELHFPGDPAMSVVNDLLDKCVVDDEAKCVLTAESLLTAIDIELDRFKQGGQRLQETVPWKCRVCGLGTYNQVPEDRFLMVPVKRGPNGMGGINALLSGDRSQAILTTRVFSCRNCGNIQLFFYADGQRPQGWVPPPQK